MLNYNDQKIGKNSKYISLIISKLNLTTNTGYLIIFIVCNVNVCNVNVINILECKLRRGKKSEWKKKGKEKREREKERGQVPYLSS